MREPITAEKNASWTMDNITERAKANPYTFYSPSQEAIAEIQPGEHVKLFFTGPERESENIRTERMWVLVTEVDGDRFKGTLANDPALLRGISHGDSVTFSALHVANTLKDDPVPSPTEKYEVRCLASDQILRKHQQVASMHREEPMAEDDSGWRFTAPGEVLERMRADHISIVSLGAVLSRDDSMLAHLDAPVGSVFTKNPDTGMFEPTPESSPIIDISARKQSKRRLH